MEVIKKELTDIGVKQFDIDETFAMDTMITFVKGYKMSSLIKNNRINFFSTSIIHQINQRSISL